MPPPQVKTPDAIKLYEAADYLKELLSQGIDNEAIEEVAAWLNAKGDQKAYGDAVRENRKTARRLGY